MDVLGPLRRLFREQIAPEVSAPSPEGREHGLRRAAAALLFEVVRADAEVKDEELTVMRTAVQSVFGLTGPEADELVQAAGDASREATSVYELTREVDLALDPEQKKRLVELLWMVAFADAEKSAHEEHMVRKIASLLHVPHPDFIDAKLRARASSRID